MTDNVIVTENLFLVCFIQEVASTMEVKAMPTFVLMKDGLVEKVVGANPDEIRKRIDNLVHSMPVAVS